MPGEKIGFVGAGNMAGAIAGGLIESGVFGPDRLAASDKSEAALKRMSENLGIECFASNAGLVRACSTLVFSVKPQVMAEVLEGLKGEIKEGHLVLSIAAGIPVKMIQGILGDGVPVVRVMPNTPALVGRGVSALAGGQGVERTHMDLAVKILGAVGETVIVEERFMDAVTAVSGSGPAYVFRIMEHLVDEGRALGLEAATAFRLVVETFLGAAYLAKGSGKSLSALREMVTSPGGTTEAGLKKLDTMGLEEALRQAVRAARDRSMELGAGIK